ncbi:Transposase [Cordylochernes scorpioides]|uniref:Transposase n=1 Tax=Cordylochernes scorpioides TaxID=51811 RepID=A0ABY6LKU9_9ARAC|nr:Transposase [Cordylochernes scorpioides]
MAKTTIYKYHLGLEESCDGLAGQHHRPLILCHFKFVNTINIRLIFENDHRRRIFLINLISRWTNHSISTRTISRRLVANGLHSCRPLRRLPLTPPNRRQRLEWCRARSTWMTEWHRVVFSDESRFCLSSDSRRVRVWRRRGERSNPAAIVERPTVRQRGIMVWDAIAYDSRSPLLRIQGTMTAQRYVDDVLRPVTLPYLQGVPNALYQQDNARPHTARISQQALQDVQMLPWPPYWPPYSPDLSPIEHVWDIIGRRLHALPQPRSEDELWQLVEREWRAIPQDAIRTLIDSLPRRVAACIAVRGGPTCY